MLFSQVSGIERSPPQEQISLVDIGFNISSRQFNADLNYVLERARLSGVSTLVCTGTSIKASRQNIQLCLSQSNVEVRTWCVCACVCVCVCFGEGKGKMKRGRETIQHSHLPPASRWGWHVHLFSLLDFLYV